MRPARFAIARISLVIDEVLVLQPNEKAERVANILLFGKLPPIEGGVAVRTLMLCRALAAEGHAVTVITNARDVAPTLRTSFAPADDLRYRVLLEGIQVEHVCEADNASHIPHSRSYVTRMVGRALRLTQRFDLVLGVYFQPYGVAAALTARSLGTPSAILHAGSDIGRLALNPDYLAAYRDVFRGSWALSSTQRSRPLLNRVFDDRAILPLRATHRLPSFFNQARGENGDDTALSELGQAVNGGLAAWPHDLPAPPRAQHEPMDVFGDRSGPVIGVYGKAGEEKGHFDLLVAAAAALRRGARFRIVFATGGQLRPLRKLLSMVASDEHLRQAVSIWPFLAPWRIPDFIDRCTAVAFLERDFEIAVHGPQVPKEVMWRGVPLICSSEIIGKQGYREAMLPWVNYIPAGDPRDSDALAVVLERALREPDLRAIGIAGRSVVKSFLKVEHPADAVVEALREAQLLEP